MCGTKLLKCSFCIDNGCRNISECDRYCEDVLEHARVVHPDLYVEMLQNTLQQY